MSESNGHRGGEESQEQHWLRMYQQLVGYKAKRGDCWVPRPYKANPYLGEWVDFQRYLYQKNIMPQGHRILMDKLEFGKVPNDKQEWQSMYKQLLEYKAKYGDCKVPRSYKENPYLGEWVDFYRSLHRTNRLPSEQRKALDNIDFASCPRGRHTWHDMLSSLKAFHILHGHYNVPKGYNKQLSFWGQNQGRHPQSGTYRTQLDSIRFFGAKKRSFSSTKPSYKKSTTDFVRDWNTMFERLKVYLALNGHTIVPPHYYDANLFKWVDMQRKFPLKSGPWREKLDSIGFYAPRRQADSNNINSTRSPPASISVTNHSQTKVAPTSASSNRTTNNSSSTKNSTPLPVALSEPLLPHLASTIASLNETCESSTQQERLQRSQPALVQTTATSQGAESLSTSESMPISTTSATRRRHSHSIGQNSASTVASANETVALSQQQLQHSCSTSKAPLLGNQPVADPGKLNIRATLLPLSGQDRPVASGSAAANSSRCQEAAVPRSSLEPKDGHHDKQSKTSTLSNPESDASGNAIRPLAKCCGVCGDKLGQEGGQQTCRFGSNELFSKEIAVHVFCGLTASMNPDKAQYQYKIHSAKRIRDKFSSHSDVLLERAMKLSRKGTSDNTAGKEVFYLVKDFNTSLMLIKKHFSDICLRMEGRATRGDDFDSKALSQLDKELEDLFGTHLDTLSACDGGGNSKKASVSRKGARDNEQALKSAKTRLAQADEQKAPRHVTPQTITSSNKIPSTAHRSSLKVGRYVTCQVDTRQDLGMAVDSETHIVTFVHHGKQANQAEIAVGSRIVSINGNRIKRRPIATMWREAQEKGSTAEIALQPECKLFIDDSSSVESMSDEYEPLDDAVI